VPSSLPLQQGSVALERVHVGRQPLEAPELLPPREVVLPPELELELPALEVLPPELELAAEPLLLPPTLELAAELLLLAPALELAAEPLVLPPTLELVAEPLVLGPPVVPVPALVPEVKPELEALPVAVDPRLLPDDEVEDEPVVPAGQFWPCGWQYPSGQHIVPAIAVQSLG
jgi:hypothetical protein